jgi:myosin heavy subunit
MKKIYFSAVVALALIMCGCNGNKPSGEQTTGLADSTLIDAPLAEQEVQDMVNVISEIAGCLDSIQVQEQLLFKTDEMASKGEILGRLRAFKGLLDRKQEQIAQLTANNNSNKVAIANLKRMTEYLKGQLFEKAKRIAELEEVVQTKDVKISELMYDMKTLSMDNEALQEKNDAQDTQLKKAFYIVAEKKELKELGLLKGGGLLGKKRADYANMDESKFTEIDKSQVKTITIDSKKPKLITEKPDGTYTLTDNGDGTTTLEITNVDAFWASSPYLIIQK